MGKVDVPDEINRAMQNVGIGILTIASIFVLCGFIISTSKNIPLGEAITVALSIATGGGAEFIQSDLAMKSVHVIMSFAVSVLVFYIFYIIIELSISGQISEHLKGVSMMNKIKKLQGHHIICGAGRVGLNVGQKLTEFGEKVVFIERESDVINRLRGKGYLVHEAGPIDEDVLASVGIHDARGLTASLGDDGKNLLLVLTARHINPNLLIAARITDKSLVSKFKHAGANLIIIPEAVGGIKLAEAMMGRVDHAHVIQV